MAARPSDSVSGLRCQCCSCCGGFKRVTASPSDSVSVVRKVPLTFVVSQTVVLAFHSQAHSHWPDRGGGLALPRFRRVGPLHAWKLSRALSCVWIRAAFPGERAGRLYDVASFPRADQSPHRLSSSASIFWFVVLLFPSLAYRVAKQQIRQDRT